jgi:hypothetical protein
MKYPYLITLTIIFLFTACSKNLYLSVPISKIEFYDDFRFPFYSCSNCPEKYNSMCHNIHIDKGKLQWHPFSDKELIDTNYLYTIHNTIKSVGYKSLLSADIYNNRISGFIDSLIVWNDQNSDTSNYYYKFWQRRIKQGNDYTILTIIKELKMIYNNGTVPVTNSFVSKNFKQSLLFDKQMTLNQIENEKTFYLNVFNHLKDNGKYSEAYTLLHRPVDFSKLGYDKFKLMQSLPIDSVKSVFGPSNDTTHILGFFNKEHIWNDEHISWLDYPGP